MGLGKTVQALALLLHRARGGPALVVAPTSVATNWTRETARFAPTLNVRQFGPGDRAVSVADLRPFDLVICTFGLMQIESGLLAAVDWHTVIIDEAQAIKNAATKRAKAALKLNADFRLITTGTPIENNLGELHALFQFINPGLLGSREKFHRRFADPIQKTGNPQARRWLKKLISPFILRRLKHDVLEDLPPRTEVVLEVEMSEDEIAFYEALRQRGSRQSRNRGRWAQHAYPRGDHAAAPRLLQSQPGRETGCAPRVRSSPRLPKPWKVCSTPTTACSCSASSWTTSRSCASTSRASRSATSIWTDPRRRKSGNRRSMPSSPARGDVFLISLKAGGTGLNLTAADYVIHMDPWWNPASEDQASDRAHRIGQRRPVTVYRLVTKGTIEEKIVALHHEKRDLASSLLAGTDTGPQTGPGRTAGADPRLTSAERPQAATPGSPTPTCFAGVTAAELALGNARPRAAGVGGKRTAR